MAAAEPGTKCRISHGSSMPCFLQPRSLWTIYIPGRGVCNEGISAPVQHHHTLTSSEQDLPMLLSVPWVLGNFTVASVYH